MKIIIINNDLCTGCGKCQDVCTTGAITVNPTTRKAEFIAYKCAGCGACVDECREGALLLK